MPNQNKTDLLLKAMEDESTLELLYDLWVIARQCPTRAAEIIVQFRDVSISLKVMVSDLKENLTRFEALNQKLPDIQNALKILKEANRELSATDDKALNRLNRIIDAAEKIKLLKDSGALAVLKSL